MGRPVSAGLADAAAFRRPPFPDADAIASSRAGLGQSLFTGCDQVGTMAYLVPLAGGQAQADVGLSALRSPVRHGPLQLFGLCLALVVAAVGVQGLEGLASETGHDSTGRQQPAGDFHQ